MDLTGFSRPPQITHLPDREVVDALIHPEHAAPSPALAQALRTWDGSHYWSDEADGRHLILTHPWAGLHAERWWLHLLLLLLTVITTTWAGGVITGNIPDPNPLWLFQEIMAPTPGAVAAWASGFWFSLPLIAILLSHEMGHYLMARRYQLDVSPPYFIPVPLIPSFIGTMGAFIRLRTVLSDRRQLFDVGIAGPLAGFVVALPVLFLGLRLSHPALDNTLHGLVLVFGGMPVAELGDSVVTLFLRRVVLGHTAAALELHPLAFAGWVGMFVTMLNLLPISQLDGGHILYAAAPRLQERAALVFWVALLGLGYWWTGWFVWAGLVLVLHRGRLGHPNVLSPARPLPPSRYWLACAALILFLLTFAPVPFKL
ncbi:MAG TPA: site-2 protease family protein [Gemmatimonadales bacterium]|nr:site-2 protease family protein [Gemmatimonadales bacterium]